MGLVNNESRLNNIDFDDWKGFRAGLELWTIVTPKLILHEKKLKHVKVQVRTWVSAFYMNLNSYTFFIARGLRTHLTLRFIVWILATFVKMSALLAVVQKY